jgi:Phytanoyl-CoA dioxygenase (PhyH)
MPITDCGYAMGRDIFGPAEVELMRTSIGDTIDRIARGFLTPFETSYPGLPLEERLERVAQKDRAYAYALLHGVFADAQHDPRLSRLANHPVLMDRARQFLAPKQVTGQIIRVRVNIPSFPQKRSPWHQDVTGQNDLSAKGSTVGMACWIPLVDATEANGTLEVLPGVYDKPYQHEQTPEGTFYIRDDLLPDASPITLPCPAGDVVFLDRFVPHRTLPNRTSTIRWNVVMWVKCQV